MHALLGLSSVLLIVLAGYLALGLLSRQAGWSRRRDLQLLVLAAPVVSLGLVLGALHHFVAQVCFVGAPPWDYLAGVAVPLVTGLAALGGLALGGMRLALMARLMAGSGRPANPELQAVVRRLAAQLGVPTPRLLVCPYARPLALTSGLFRPAVLISAWMVEHLDRRELEAVLAHELSHVVRRDYLVVWLATVLRDAFFYLPTGWAAYRQLQREKELACDDLAVGVTNRPLALASALAKVWQQALVGPGFGLAQPLVQTNEPIEGRIERLLAEPVAARSGPVVARGGRRAWPVALGALAVIGVLGSQVANFALMLVPMGCGPAALLGRLLS
jgi:Zn-dependent protease with chaperone function